MTDPIVIKVSNLKEISELVSNDLFEVVDISEPLAANKTKKMSASKVKLFNADQITDGIVANSKITNSAVTTVKLAASAVTEVKIAANAVTAGKLANGSVTAIKLASDTKRIVGRVIKNGTQNVNAATGAYLTSWTSNIDDNSMWSNNQFTINTAGIYAVYFNGAISEARNVGIRVQHNRGGTLTWIADQTFTGAVTPTRISCFGIYSMNVGDTIRPWLENNESSTTVTVVASLSYSDATFYTQFGLYRIN